MPGQADQCYSSFVHNRLEFGSSAHGHRRFCSEEMKWFKRTRQRGFAIGFHGQIFRKMPRR
jgi:hypothetical protein